MLKQFQVKRFQILYKQPLRRYSIYYSISGNDVWKIIHRGVVEMIIFHILIICTGYFIINSAHSFFVEYYEYQLLQTKKLKFNSY
jgi:hypothetical protein